MPSNTPNFALPYPSAGDRPCDFAEQWCDFAEAIDAVFATFNEAVNRTVPAIPMAAIRKTVVGPVENSVFVPFDTVLVDTAGMVDLDVDPFHITVTHRGRYSVVGFLEKFTNGAPLNAQVTLFVGSASFDILAGGIDRGAAFVYRYNAYTPVMSLEVGERVRLYFNTGTSVPSTVSRASLSLAWHSDVEVP